MKGINISLILVCFVFFSLSSGYRVQRSDDDTDDLLDNTTIDEDNIELNGNSNDELNVNPNDELNANSNDELNANSNDELNDDIQNSIVDYDVDNDNVDEDPIDESNPDIEISITEPVPDEGVEGSLEVTDEGVEGSAEVTDEGVEGSLEVTDLPDIFQGSKNFIPNTKNCSSFYDCTNKESSFCPTEMWFDPNYTEDTLCQYPEVICAADNSICDCAELYPPLLLDPLIETTVTCLKDNRFHLIASKVNCGRYFVCHNEMAYRMECRAGLHYNSKTEMCDYAEVVNCRIPDPDCPLEGIKFLPDAERCEVFYFCVHGFKTKQSCPFYHIWDVRTNSCQRQDEAICHLTN